MMLKRNAYNSALMNRSNTSGNDPVLIQMVRENYGTSFGKPMFLQRSGFLVGN
jgi:hypothetical protein